MKTFELYYFCILFICFLIYIRLCYHHDFEPINQVNKFKVTTPNNILHDKKYINLSIHILGIICSILLITFDINYIVNNHGKNIYLRSIQFTIILLIFILINIPTEYKNNHLIKISNSSKPMIIAITFIISSCITSFLIYMKKN
jgi:hypothetical protein